MPTTLLICDGYEQDFYIDVLDETLRGKFRPMTMGERETYFEKTSKMAAEARSKHTNEVIAAHLVSWDAKMGDGTIAPTTPALVGMLKPAMYGRLWGIVSGAQASDPDPANPQADAPKPAAESEATDLKN